MTIFLLHLERSVLYSDLHAWTDTWEAKLSVARLPRKLFKIGELMEHRGFSRQTLHSYTMLGLIRVARRTPSGHRLYDEDVFEVLERIKDLKKNHTLEEIQKMLAEDREGKRDQKPKVDS
jgi:hypothetical protein